MTVDVNDRVLVTIANGVAELVLNRPDKRNALDDALFVALARATRDLVDDRSVRAVILAGNGAAFCAGLDFASFASFASESESGERPFGEPGRRGSGCRSPGTGQAIVANLRAIRVPVIAAIDGAAIGGGLQLALGCDIRIAGVNAKLAAKEIDFGITLDMAGTQLLPRLVGDDRALELILTGGIVGAGEAFRLGLVTTVADDGQTGPWASLPSHGLNMDALADMLIVDMRDDYPTLGWSFTSWGNELGSTYAAMAICAALVNVRSGGGGPWIDLSCWDTLVEAHRTELAMNHRRGLGEEPYNGHDQHLGALYNTYLTSDGKVVLLAALEPKFWSRFCDKIGRPDLISRHTGNAIEFGGEDEGLRHELIEVFASATADEWDARFVDWDVPGSKVLEAPEVMKQAHFAARRIVEGEPGGWPNIASAIRWHHVDERAGSGLTPPPALGADGDAIIKEWLA